MIIGSPEWYEALNKPRTEQNEPASQKSVIDLWANFLYNEKLDTKKMAPEWVAKLILLAEAMAQVRGPKIRMHKDKLESRRFVCFTAINMGIDLPAIKYRGKPIIGRGLLDMWNKVSTELFGSVVGTVSWREAKRRDVMTRFCKERKTLTLPKDCQPYCPKCGSTDIEPSYSCKECNYKFTINWKDSNDSTIRKNDQSVGS